MKPINLERLFLASQSPRRKGLLEQTGIELEIVPSDIDEEDISIKNPMEYVKTLSFMKAEKVSTAYPDSWILGADTIVVVRNQILGKPETEDQAMEMLRLLSGREHLVFTGFCIMNKHKQTAIKTAVETRVWFKSLSDQEIKWYVSTPEPFDKAGGYGIQGLGAFLVRKIFGSYSNVVGLPVCEVVEALMKLKIIEMRA
jgi:septum formation protein